MNSQSLTFQVFIFLIYKMLAINLCSLPKWLSGKESSCNAGDVGSIPGWGRSPGEEHGSPLQYSRLENSMDGGAWWAASPRGRKELDTAE